MNKSVYEKHYKQLIGYTLKDVVVIDDEDDEFFDEEGNGTGHLDIQAYDDKA